MNLRNIQNSEFYRLFSKNLQKEIDRNPSLKDSIYKFSIGISSLYTRYQNSLSNRFLNNVIFPPLKLADLFVKKVIIKEIASDRLNNLASLVGKINNFTGTNQIGSKLYVPQFYGGNVLSFSKDYIDSDRTCKRILEGEMAKKQQYTTKSYVNKIFSLNKDEKSIHFYQNKYLPNLFFNKKFIIECEKTKGNFGLLEKYLLDKFRIKSTNFYLFKCIDMREIDTDGFDVNENIIFTFKLRVNFVYAKKTFIKNIIDFDCSMKFDGNNKLLSFNFVEM